MSGIWHLKSKSAIMTIPVLLGSASWMYLKNMQRHSMETRTWGSKWYRVSCIPVNIRCTNNKLLAGPGNSNTSYYTRWTRKNTTNPVWLVGQKKHLLLLNQSVLLLQYRNDSVWDTMGIEKCSAELTNKHWYIYIYLSLSLCVCLCICIFFLIYNCRLPPEPCAMTWTLSWPRCWKRRGSEYVCGSLVGCWVMLVGGFHPSKPLMQVGVTRKQYFQLSMERKKTKVWTMKTTNYLTPER